MSNDQPQPNPQNHDLADDAGIDKPSQAEGSESQADQALADKGLTDQQSGGDDGPTGGHD